MALAAEACKLAGLEVQGAQIMLTDTLVTKKHRR